VYSFAFAFEFSLGTLPSFATLHTATAYSDQSARRRIAALLVFSLLSTLPLHQEYIHTMPTTAVSLVTGLLPGLDNDITRYISGIWDEHDEDISEDDSEDGLREFVRPLLEGEGVDEEEINAVIEQIRSLRPASPGTSSAGPSRSAKRLDKAIDMKNNPSVSFTTSLQGPVDIESTTKGRNTQVDLKKLEKAEAKIKAKMEKRARRTVEFEGSKLVDAAKAQKAYEEMYMTVNPLQNHALNKGKSKDILLEAIDVSYGSNQILSNAA
jgi:ATP-binding cassette subfamily F protein 3